jgi:hypothetical protein
MMQPAPQGAPEQTEAAEGAQGGGAATQLITGIQSGLKKLGGLLEKSGVGSPEQMQAYSALIAQYEELMESIVSEGGAGAKPEPTSASTPEQGGNPNARPM